MNINPDNPYFNLIASIDSLLDDKAIAIEYIPPMDHQETIYTVVKLFLKQDILVYAEEFEGIAALLCRFDKHLNEKHILIVVYIPISEVTIEHLFSLGQLDIAGEFKGQIILNFSDFELYDHSDDVLGYDEDLPYYSESMLDDPNNHEASDHDLL